MTRYVALLRGINLGKRRPPMSQLKALFEELKFEDVETFIASGNVVFSSKEKDRAKLETKIEQHLEKSLGYDVDTFVRTEKEIVTIAKAKAFPEDGKDGIIVHVGFLKGKLPAATAKKLAAIKTDVDEFRIDDLEYYWLCRIRTSDSKVWTLPEVRALKLPTSSMRNLTSVRKLVAKHFA